ncbi:MAG TPA: hypothetical protein ENI80_05740 [Acidiferrobacteraceae bacterium]|nr:hypothetical protein [Acidiferrobacteraceae bacterium]
MDKTILDLSSLLIAGGGLFAVLTKFAVPPLNATYWNENTYALKRDQIDHVMAWLFTGMAGIGILVQFTKLGILYDLPERSYGTATYITVFILGFLVMIIILLLVLKIGHWFAKRRWFPEIVESQRPSYQDAKFIIEHGGWREDQWEQRESFQ